jgi:transcriptional regulator with XRE-family HTH domain
MNLLHISQIVKEIRLRQKMTVEGLANKVGVSKGFISRLENFRATPSLATLDNIAKSLGITMADFFQDNVKTPQFVFGNIASGEKLNRNNSQKYGMNYFSLAYSKFDRKLDPFVVEYSHCKKKRELDMHESDEFFLVLEGSVLFYLYDLDKPKLLAQGDTVYLNKNIPHRAILKPETKYAKALIIYYNE